LKEQYWKRTIGPVRTALERSLLLLDRYGIGVEMGHKEVGGVKAKMGNSGHYDHVMEQLEIDWKFSTALQAADNENQVKYLVKDYPILLLDDVLSELDGNRQEHLLSGINHIQTMITCTGLEDFITHRFQIDKIYKVVEGTVTGEN